jgi:hypothetical protein
MAANSKKLFRQKSILGWAFSQMNILASHGTHEVVLNPDFFSLLCQQSSLSEANDEVLQKFLRSSWSWGREQVLLPRRLRGTLWALIPVQILWAIWLTKILTEARPCGGPICRVATLGHHPALLLACAVISVTGLVGLIPFTRGLSRSNDRELVGIAAASAAGGIALLGIAALLTGVVIALILLALFILGFTAT